MRSHHGAGVRAGMLGYWKEKEAMNTILCFLCLSLIGWICLFIGLAQSRRFRARVAVETIRVEGIIQSYEVEEKPWGRGPTAKCYHPVVGFSVDGHPGRSPVGISARKRRCISAWWSKTGADSPQHPARPQKRCIPYLEIVLFGISLDDCINLFQLLV